jgi:hypothetical protein
VGSKLIASLLAILFSPTSFLAFTKDKLFYPIPIIIPIIGLIILLIIFFVIIIINRKKFINKNNENNILNDNIMILRKKLNANNFDDLSEKVDILLNENKKLRNNANKINNIPYSKRYELFKTGDIVKRKLDGPINAKQLTVRNIADNYIFATDINGNEQRYSPEELSTVSEYENELNEFRKDFRNILYGN